ncbi:aminotransferase class V-fold PLP-dependent enzyme, partial [Escherichia coli]|nr:aminotransferase class V-fold PLP-dependent enzyme [Escherichia coli]
AKTAGGIIIPDTAQEKPQEGEVVAVGSGAKNEKGEVTPLDVKAGDRILLSTLEHHSNIVPWQMVAERVGAEIDVVPLTADQRIDLD